MDVIVFSRNEIGQNDAWIKRMRAMFIDRNRGVGIDELNEAGSNEEKISDIIQNMVVDHLEL